jgi:hypothetical protein
MRWTECASVSCHGTKPLAREKAARDWRLGSGVVTTLIEQRSRSGCSVLRIEGASTPTLKTGAPMSKTPISPLRQRMLDDMSVGSRPIRKRSSQMIPEDLSASE